jgi:hypothetical protein
MKFTSIFTLTLLAAAPALAQNDITWVSHSGSDSPNTLCTTDSPCRTFAWAYTNTQSGGIVKAMDAGEYGIVTIKQPITIDGNGVGAEIDVSTPSGIGVSVETTSLVKIQNLGIHVAAGCRLCNGIKSVNSNVSIENVSITGAPENGVFVHGGSGAIHGVTVTGAIFGISVEDATATISDSIGRYSSGAGISVIGAAAVTQVLIERSQMISNTYGLSVQDQGFAATARISDCVITGNTIGSSTFGGGQIISFRNNTWAGNTTDGSTPISISQK